MGKTLAWEHLKVLLRPVPKRLKDGIDGYGHRILEASLKDLP
jgi:hypothetical protein